MEKLIILLLWILYAIKVRHFEYALFGIVNGQDAIALSLYILKSKGYVGRNTAKY